MDSRKKKISFIKFMALLLIFIIADKGTAVFGASAEKTVTITKDRQSVDKFCDVKSYYIKGSSNTGNYCCAAYVKRFYAALYDVSVSQINTYAGPPVVSAVGKNVSLKQVTKPQPGDIMQNTQRSHVAIVKSVKGSEVTLIEQNWKWTMGGVVYAKINRKIDTGSAYFYRLVINGKAVSPAKNIKQPDDCQIWQVSSIGGINLRKSYKVTSKALSVIPYNAILKVTKTKKVLGETWGNTEYNGKKGWILLSNANYVWGEISNKDKEPPVISDIKISKVSSSGYTVTCKVTDNSGVVRVQFPTWTESEGQDDLISDWSVNTLYSGTIEGDTVTFRVNRKEHNNEYGIYNTHIYAYDMEGNSSGMVSNGAEIGKSPDIPSKFTARIYNKKSERYLTYAGSYASINNIKEDNAQIFSFVKQKDGYYIIQSLSSGKYLYVSESGGKGKYVRFGNLKNKDAWRWRIYGKNGTYLFRNKTGTEVMIPKSDKIFEGNKLRMNSQKNSNTFTFNIIRI